MEVANDLLGRQQRVVADVVNRDLDADRSPLRTIKSKFASGAPRFRFDPTGWFAKQCLLRRIEHPRLIAVECDRQVLVAGPFDGTTDPLRRVIPCDDADLLAVDVQHRLDVAGLIQSVEVASTGAGARSLTGADATDGDLDQISDVGRVPNSNDRPLQTGLRRVSPPEDLGRTLRL